MSPERKDEIEVCLLALVPRGVNPHTIHTRVLVAEERSVAQAIVHVLRRIDPDLVVMSSHGHTGLSGALHGSVTEAVLRRSPKPVLIVPQERSHGPAR